MNFFTKNPNLKKIEGGGREGVEWCEGGGGGERRGRWMDRQASKLGA